MSKDDKRKVQTSEAHDRYLDHALRWSLVLGEVVDALKHAQNHTVGFLDVWLFVLSALKLVGRWPLKEGNPWLHHVFRDRET